MKNVPVRPLPRIRTNSNETNPDSNVVGFALAVLGFTIGYFVVMALKVSE